MAGQRFDVVPVAGEDRAARFSERHDDRVDCGAVAGFAAELRGASGKWLRHLSLDDARLQEAVDGCVSSGVTLQRLHEDDGGDKRGPKFRCPQGTDQGERARRAFGETTHSATVEHEHV
jgi:hypothetical protein